MAKKESKPAAEPEVTKKSPFKTIIIIAVVMLVEAGVLIGVAMFTKTPAVNAQSEFQSEDGPDTGKTVEVTVVRDRFPNNKQGVLYLYDTSITVRVAQTHQTTVQEFVDSNQALIKTRIAGLWRNAEPRHFNEPLLSTLTRQAEEALREIMPRDPKTGESLVQAVLLEGVTPYRAGI